MFCTGYSVQNPTNNPYHPSLLQDHLRKALRLSECPRIEALLDRCCLFQDPTGKGKIGNKGSGNASDDPSTCSATGSISVASLISFVENGRRQAPKSTSGEQDRERQQQQQRQKHYLLHNHLPQQRHQFPFSITSDEKLSRQSKSPQTPSPSLSSQLPTASTPVSVVKATIEPIHSSDARSHGTADMSTPPSSPATAPASCQGTSTHAPSPRGNYSHGTTASVNDNERESAANPASTDGEGLADGTGGDILSPRIVPLTSKWALSPSTTPTNAKKPSGGTQKGTGTTNTPMNRGGRQEDANVQNHRPPSLSATTSSSGGTGAEKLGEDSKLDNGRETLPVNKEESRERGGGHCTTLVRHLGAVLGLRGKDAYRRPGSGLPVWRKRETLIQERIVQYTTLDEEGTVSVFLR